MAEQVREVMREEGRTINDLIRESLRNHTEKGEWLRTIRSERLMAREAKQEEADRRTIL